MALSSRKILNPTLPGGLLSPIGGADELTASEEAMIDNLVNGQFQSITPTGAINDVNDTYTLPGNPILGSLHLEVNGKTQYDSGVDYTISGSNDTGITFVIPPSDPSAIRAWFLSTST